MRTNLLFIFMVLTVIFSGCNRNDDFTTEDNSVTLKALHEVATRVTFDGQKSMWSNGDCLNVVIDGIEDIYTFNYKADSDCDFVCNNLTMPAEQNDIVAYYGVDAENIDVTDMCATINLGASFQTQSIELPLAHIAQYDILYGKALQAAKSDIQIAMKHSVAAIKVNITNTLSEEKSIKSVAITAPETVILAGNYFINPMTDEITLADNFEASNRVTLTFEDDIVLNAEDDIAAWIATAPFALEAGDELTIDITASDDEVYRCVKTIPESGAIFNAGCIMSTTIRLGEDAKLVKTNVPTESERPAEITIIADPTISGVMPSDFPKSTKDKVQNGDFVLAGYTFGFESPTPFYLSNNNRIRFESGITKTNIAMIKLPVIDGYKLTSVTLASISANSTRNYMFAITNIDKSEIIGGEAFKLTEIKHSYNLTNNTECYIRISNTSTSVNTNPADLAYISLKYAKIE